jgi:hypothetical protein
MHAGLGRILTRKHCLKKVNIVLLSKLVCINKNLITSSAFRLLGFKRKGPVTKTQSTQNLVENILNDVDVELIMETIHMFVTTIKQLKPLPKEITPFMNQFI